MTDDDIGPTTSRPMNEKEWATSRAASLLMYCKKQEIEEDTRFVQKFMENGWTIIITNMDDVDI